MALGQPQAPDTSAGNESRPRCGPTGGSGSAGPLLSRAGLWGSGAWPCCGLTGVGAGGSGADMGVCGTKNTLLRLCKPYRHRHGECLACLVLVSLQFFNFSLPGDTYF